MEMNNSDKVFDGLIDWKRKNVIRKNTMEEQPEGFFLYTLEKGQPVESEDAVSYMRILLEKTGIDMTKIAGWEEYLRVSHKTLHIPKRTNSKGLRYSGGTIPQGTMFLLINVNHMRDPETLFDLTRTPIVVEAMKQDPEAVECAGRLVEEERIFRACLDINIRTFLEKKRPEYDTPMTRLMAKPDVVKAYRYNVSLSNVDLVVY